MGSNFQIDFDMLQIIPVVADSSIAFCKKKKRQLSGTHAPMFSISACIQIFALLY